MRHMITKIKKSTGGKMRMFFTFVHEASIVCVYVCSMHAAYLEQGSGGYRAFRIHSAVWVHGSFAAFHT